MLKKALIALVAVFAAFTVAADVSPANAHYQAPQKKAAVKRKVAYAPKHMAYTHKKVSYKGGYNRMAYAHKPMHSNVAVVHPQHDGYAHGGYGHGGMMPRNDGSVWLSSSIRDGATCHVTYTEAGHPPAWQYKTAYPCDQGGTKISGLEPGRNYAFHVSPDHKGTGGVGVAVAMAH